MSKLTATAVLLLVLLAVLAERERRADLQKMQTQPFPPVRPAVQWPPCEPAPKQPELPHIPKEVYEMLPCHVPFHLDEELP